MQEPIQVFNQPSLIAKPSVVAGKEHQWHIRYNPLGQPTQITETGYAPADIAPTDIAPTVIAGETRNLSSNSLSDNRNEMPNRAQHDSRTSSLRAQRGNPDGSQGAIPISRTTTYTYAEINGRSLLTQIDGALPNAYQSSKQQHLNNPANSDMTQYHYDKLGQYLTQIVAPNNLVTQLAYDTIGRAEAGGSDHQTQHNQTATGGTGRVVQSIASNGIATQYTYANLGNNAGKILSTQRYPASLSLASAKSTGLLQTTAMAYDVFGNTTMIKRADGQAVYLQYANDGQHGQTGADGKLTQLRDGLGNRVDWKGWQKGKLQDTSHSVSTQLSTQQWYTADAPDTVARAWYFWHDDQQRMTQRLSPDGGIDTWRYSDDKSNNTRTPEPQASELDPAMTTALQAQTQWVQHIDPLNRMTLNVINNQDAAQIRMTSAGYMDASIQANANNTNTQDNAKQTADATAKGARAASQPKQIADDFGRSIQFSSPQHGTHTAHYDAANHMTRITQADGTQIDYRYDVSGRLLSKTASQPAINTSANRMVKATVKQTTNATGGTINPATIKYRYNAFGLQQIQDPHQTIRYTQDLLGREIDKATTLTIQNKPATENSQPNQVKPTLLKTYHIRIRYDALGHVKAKQLIDGNWLVFTLDDKTGLTTAMRLHKTIWPSLTNKLAGWLNLPDLPLQIASRQSIVTDITVHPFNGITQVTHGNGINDDYSFDIAGRLTTVSHGNQFQIKKTNGAFIKASYTYDAGRRLVSERMDTSNPAGAVTLGNIKEYAYTGWNQLATPVQASFRKVRNIPSAFKGEGKLAQSTAYEETSNVTTSATNSTTASARPSEIQLDAAGRTIADAHFSYSYNVWGKLAAVQTNTNNNNRQTIASYQSNALGERIMASYPDLDNSKALKTRYYLYDHQQRIAELDEKGNVLQQYLYINQTPVAVINTPTNQATDNDTATNNTANKESNPTGIIAIHTDRRNAPNAATDEQGKVIWQTQYDAWGKVLEVSNANQTGAQNTFNLALRLPGQWQDQATGLHYNYQRDYNPDTGRYLTPDLLGYPDGVDPYAYVNNDPLNKIDPFGLYQSDIHYYMTFFLAVAAGVPAEDARIIALATQYIDDNKETEPLNITNGVTDEHRARLLTYHFTAIQDIKLDANTSKVSGKVGDYGDAYIGTDTSTMPGNDQLVRLLKASETAKKCLTKNAELQFFGEYLHAFEDTFAHRDQDNNPFALSVGLGHSLSGSDPDYTYNHWGLLPTPTHWDNNAERTFNMEMMVFQQMKKYATGNDVISQGKITQTDFEQLLKDFNAIEENEGDGYEKGKQDLSDPSKSTLPSGAKITKLQEKLDEWFDGAIDIRNFNNAAYNESLAASNRASFLCENSKPLDQKVYEGTILPTTCN